MKINFILFLPCILFFVVDCGFAKERTKLLFVQIMFRHGDRAPISLFPSDPNPASVWEEGLGELTVLGRKQHYALGKYFRHMYQNFITSSPVEVNVTSSADDRCLKSAATNLASFYAPNKEWKFDNDLDWQPISVHYIPKSVDKYLEVGSNCPRADEETKRIHNSPEGQEFLNKHKEMFETLTRLSGIPITEWKEASDFHDTLLIEKKYNLSIPSWVEPYWDELHDVARLSFNWSFGSPLIERLRAGPLIKRIIENMKLKLNGDIPDQKVQIYSTHDTSIVVVLEALNLYQNEPPPYCAAVLFELHEKSDGKKVVRLRYMNSTNPETEIQAPHVLVLNGCSEFCPLDSFEKFTKHLIPDDWNLECQLQKSFIQKVQDKNVTIVLFAAIIAIIIIVMVIFMLGKIYSRKRIGICLVPVK